MCALVELCIHGTEREIIHSEILQTETYRDKRRRTDERTDRQNAGKTTRKSDRQMGRNKDTQASKPHVHVIVMAATYVCAITACTLT